MGLGGSVILRWLRCSALNASTSIGLVFVLAAGVTCKAATFPDVIDRIKPSVVVIGTFSTLRSPQFAMRGTGFVVLGGNLAVTNAHVVGGDAPEPDNAVLCLLVNPGKGASNQVRRAERIAVDKAHDLALLRFDGDPLPAVTLNATAVVREGQSIAFTGFPIGGALGFSPVTHRGTISSITAVSTPAPTAGNLSEKVIISLRRGSFSVYQLDATAYPGNSGSPLFDAETGDVVGVINSVFVKGTKESMLSQPSGISYAIPVSYVNELIQGNR